MGSSPYNGFLSGKESISKNIFLQAEAKFFYAEWSIHLLLLNSPHHIQIHTFFATVIYTHIHLFVHILYIYNKSTSEAVDILACWKHLEFKDGAILCFKGSLTKVKDKSFNDPQEKALQTYLFSFGAFCIHSRLALFHYFWNIHKYFFINTSFNIFLFFFWSKHSFICIFFLSTTSSFH